MIGNMTKDQFDPATNYDHFYENHQFAPFPEEHTYTSHEVLPRAAWALDVAKENGYKTFIDLCCLDGFVGLTLAKQAGMSGIGVDLSEPGIKLLNKRAKDTLLPVSGVQKAGEDYFTAKKVDMIMMFEAVEHFKDTPAILKQYISYLKPGGSILISTPDLDGFYGDTNEDACHLRVYTYKRGKDTPKVTSLGKPVVSLPDEIESLGGTVHENEVWNDLIHLRATFS